MQNTFQLQTSNVSSTSKSKQKIGTENRICHKTAGLVKMARAGFTGINKIEIDPN